MSDSKKLTFAQRAAAQPTELHVRFAKWLETNCNIDNIDLKSVQLACSLRMDFQASEDNQQALAARRSEAANKQAKAAAAKRARLEAQLKKINDELEASKKNDAKVAVTIIYKDVNGPEAHKTGCADIAKLLKRDKSAYAEEIEITHLDEIELDVYSDHINSGESSLADCRGATPCKPCLDGLLSDEELPEPQPEFAAALEAARAKMETEVDATEDADKAEAELDKEIAVELEEWDFETNGPEGDDSMVAPVYKGEMTERNGVYMTKLPKKVETDVEIRRGRSVKKATIYTYGNQQGNGDQQVAIFVDSKGVQQETWNIKRV
jgi:hypothetical protein